MLNTYYGCTNWKMKTVIFLSGRLKFREKP